MRLIDYAFRCNPSFTEWWDIRRQGTVFHLSARFSQQTLVASVLMPAEVQRSARFANEARRAYLDRLNLCFARAVKPIIKSIDRHARKRR